jgi:hypothetical protein
MHLWLLAIGGAAFWLFKSGKLNFVVKKGLQQAYKSLFKRTEDFDDFVEIKEKKEDIDIPTGSYVYKADSALFETLKTMDFRLDFSLSFYREKQKLSQTIILEKSGAKHKFYIKGDYKIKGKVVYFTPNEGDLSLLPADLRDSVIKFVVDVDIDKDDNHKLKISFNEDQMGSLSLGFEYQ